MKTRVLTVILVALFSSTTSSERIEEQDAGLTPPQGASEFAQAFQTSYTIRAVADRGYIIQGVYHAAQEVVVFELQRGASCAVRVFSDEKLVDGFFLRHGNIYTISEDATLEFASLYVLLSDSFRFGGSLLLKNWYSSPVGSTPVELVSSTFHPPACWTVSLQGGIVAQHNIQGVLLAESSRFQASEQYTLLSFREFQCGIAKNELPTGFLLGERKDSKPIRVGEGVKSGELLRGISLASLDNKVLERLPRGDYQSREIYVYWLSSIAYYRDRMDVNEAMLLGDKDSRVIIIGGRSSRFKPHVLERLKSVGTVVEDPNLNCPTYWGLWESSTLKVEEECEEGRYQYRVLEVLQ